MIRLAIERDDIRQKLALLERAASKDKWSRLLLGLKYFISFLRGQRLSSFQTKEALAEDFENIYLPITAQDGLFLYTLARSCHAKRIIEFGSSYGVSALYLAAAVIDNGGGEFIGTEMNLKKADSVNKIFSELGWSGTARVIAGDALQTLGGIDGEWDMLFLDGWKNLYADVFNLMDSKIKNAGIILAADVDKFKKRTEDFVNSISESGRFDVVKLPICS